MIRPQIRKSVEQHHIPCPKPPDRKPKSRGSKRDSHVRNQNILGVLRPEIRSITTEIEMASLPPRRCRHSLQGEVVDGKVDRESNQLMEEKGNECDDGGIFYKFPCLAMSFSLCIKVFFQRRNKCNIFIQIICRFMVLRMREAPRMVRDEEKLVDDESNSIVESLALAESAVPAFMSQLPETSEDEALEEGVCEPGYVTQVRQRYAGDLCGCQH